MATLTTQLNTDFTPNAGDFIAQVTGGNASLMRKNTSGAAAWALVASLKDQAVIVSNPIAGAVYRFASGANSGASVQADQ